MFKKVQRNMPNVNLNCLKIGTRWTEKRQEIFSRRWLLLFLSLCLVISGCRTTSPLPPINFSEPGWELQQGQAVWKWNRDAPEVAGELLMATRPDGRTVVQFTKTPFPFVIAQTTPQSWQVEFPAQNKTYSGRGKTPARIGWLHVADSLKGKSPPKPWSFERSDSNWKLINEKTGEVIEGFLNP